MKVLFWVSLHCMQKLHQAIKLVWAHGEPMPYHPFFQSSSSAFIRELFSCRPNKHPDTQAYLSQRAEVQALAASILSGPI